MADIADGPPESSLVNKPQMEYRRDIDGLRALAVIPVILYHAGFETFSGGFVGVDVFLVISGYLITGIVLNELEAGTFSLVAFYERRARRILPALFLVMAVCIPAAWVWLLPSDMRGFSQSLVAVSAFSSNILFWLRGGYFDATAELTPLLHTWSLGVEEQFYILFPLLMVSAWRFGKKWLAALLATGSIASLAAAHWGAANRPIPTFFLLHARAWELAMGSLIAFYCGRKERLHTPPAANQLLSLAGMALVGYSVLAFDKTTPFPSLYALAPTVGTALVILFARPDTYVARVLGSGVLVSIGVISYSAYLWHQPLFVFARHRSLDELSAAVRAVLSAAAMVLAYLSWRFVERPFRAKHVVRRESVLALAIVGSMGFAAVGLAGHFTEGFNKRMMGNHLPANYLCQSWISYSPQTGVDGNACVSERASVCRVNEQPGSLRVLLVGDSHSADFMTEFRDFAVKEKVDAWQMSVGGCAFIPHHLARGGGECRKARALIEEMVAKERFQKIIFVTGMDAHLAMIDPKDVEENIESLARLLRGMLESGAEVIFFAPRPYFRVKPTKAALLGRLSEVRPIRERGRDDLDELMHRMAVDTNFVTFDESGPLLDRGCGRIECFNGHTRDLEPLYRDSNHLTGMGAKVVFQKLRPLLVGDR